MITVKDVTSSLNAMHLGNTNEWTEIDMEIDHWAPKETEVFDEVDIKMIEGEREMYELYLECCSDDATKLMEIYLSVMSDVVGGHEKAMAVLESNMPDMNCCFVNLTRDELEELVELDSERIRGIYPPYKPVRSDFNYELSTA